MDKRPTVNSFLILDLLTMPKMVKQLILKLVVEFAVPEFIISIYSFPKVFQI